jgi:hypothetical protein
MFIDSYSQFSSARIRSGLAERRSIASASTERWDAIIRVMIREDRDWQAVSSIWRADLVRAPGDVFDALEQQIVVLQSDARSKYEVILSALSPTTSGFDIHMLFEGGHVRAAFGGLVHEFSTVQTAMVWLRRGLSESYHLRTTFVGNAPCEWSLEPVSGSSTSENSLASGHCRLFAALRGKRVEYHQNHLH